jgi:hypothetical protein
MSDRDTPSGSAIIPLTFPIDLPASFYVSADVSMNAKLVNIHGRLGGYMN